MSANKWVRSISFNRTNPDDIKRLKYIGKKSFSKFVKKLIDEEIQRQKTVTPVDLTKTATPQVQQQVLPKKQNQSIAPSIPKMNVKIGGKEYV
ncbi:hypothetical protein P9E76_01335 [Schinkia azotoformans]|uniref:Uncharacterized protein n=1 Tax=Schinkia azotoformans LMG 9581 TaxID=1131731 RepID=K6DHG2_SCHAZ|nr:hypothetical protein [Schinkia azotoformans]EKN67523.1 hypothetical protein BAZO_08536 [Schinkia azotoformans LMG 9581]MEC1637316.1 hypothetical protein [Schinkia azotoformans]MEC1943720.1 hypothetical protein [Schinkia azotoformans]